MRDAGSAVQRALPLGVGLMIHLIPPGIRAGPAIEQRLRGPHEARRAGPIEPQVLRETGMGERIQPRGPPFTVAFAGSSSRNRRTAASSPRIAAEWMSLLAVSGCAARIASARSR